LQGERSKKTAKRDHDQLEESTREEKKGLPFHYHEGKRTPPPDLILEGRDLGNLIE